MKSIRLLFASAALVCAPAFAAGSPELYSFADVYRLTVGGPMVVAPAASHPDDAPLRVAMVEAPAPEPRFVIRAVAAPARWLLALAGLALAGWLAHRRLSYL